MSDSSFKPGWRHRSHNGNILEAGKVMKRPGARAEPRAVQELLRARLRD